MLLYGNSGRWALISDMIIFGIISLFVMTICKNIMYVIKIMIKINCYDIKVGADNYWNNSHVRYM